ncbi:MAG: class I SAM-dependent methyltransferase [Gammaproteobacteria bacterium]|nr:class I SAM-dependent methyltransferase [Gammaproteobacteria bacterium]
MGLRRTYTLFAPWYDAIVGPAFAEARRKSLARLPPCAGRILISGIGTGLDAAYLPPGPRYIGVDLTAAMLKRAQRRAPAIDLVQGNAEKLPFAGESFDHAVLHLILAVVPDPNAALREAARVVKTGGLILVYDKFLRRGQRAPLRRLLSPLLGRVATHTDRIFEDMLAEAPSLAVLEDRADRVNGYFRRITLKRLPD